MALPRTVLCYGDSNTFGHATVERPDGRYAPDERWVGVLAAALGPDWIVIAEGLGGRTTVSDDPIEGAEKNGKTYLLPCLASHKPLDLVVVMLGTNDLKARFNKTAWEIAAGVGVLVDIVRTAAVGRNGGVPEILVVSPPPTSDSFPTYAEMFIGAPPKSHRLAAEYRRMADERGVHFFDAGSVIKSDPVDGIHFDPAAHATLGKAIAAEIGKLAISAALGPSPLDRHDPGGVV